MELGLELGIGGFNLAVATVELTSCGVEPFLPVRLTFLGVRKMRGTARRIRDACLEEHRLERSQHLSDSWWILGDKLVNRTYCGWDDLWDEPADP